jgi:hypothetical protein
VLARLGHYAVVGRDHQQEDVDAARARDHVAHKALVSGDVDDAQLRARGQLQLGVAQLDGDAAFLLLLEAVGIDAGERLDEGGLAVVDVAGGAEDEVLGWILRR